MYQFFLSFSLEIIYFLNCATRMVEWLQQFDLVRVMAAKPSSIQSVRRA